MNDDPLRYDDLPEDEQDRMRERWAREIDRRIEALDLEQGFRERGESYVVADDDGNIVRYRPPDYLPEVIGRT